MIGLSSWGQIFFRSFNKLLRVVASTACCECTLFCIYNRRLEMRELVEVGDLVSEILTGPGRRRTPDGSSGNLLLRDNAITFLWPFFEGVSATYSRLIDSICGQ